MKHAKELARETRVEMYADWIAHDVDGLTFNLANPAGHPIENASVILAEVRANLALCLGRIDIAIAADNAAHRNQENA